MNKESLSGLLRGMERELAPELSREQERELSLLTRPQQHELSVPSRQAAQDYAPPGYREAIDPIIAALLTHLPPPGEVWPKEARKLWVDLLTGSFQMIYREPDPNLPALPKISTEDAKG